MSGRPSLDLEVFDLLAEIYERAARHLWDLPPSGSPVSLLAENEAELQSIQRRKEMKAAARLNAFDVKAVQTSNRLLSALLLSWEADPEGLETLIEKLRVRLTYADTFRRVERYHKLRKAGKTHRECMDITKELYGEMVTYNTYFDKCFAATDEYPI